MKGDNRLIDKLNDLLRQELTAINQYMVHAEMTENWGYNRIYDAVRERSIREMVHAERLIERIIFLEGQPTVSNLDQIRIGQDVASQFNLDLELERYAIRVYNEGIQLANEVGDSVTRDLLEDIAEDEDKHIDWLETQRDQIAQLTAPLYLSSQMIKQ